MCTVILALYNGAPFIQEQLQSLVEQTSVPHRILVSDDGSQDEGVDLVRAFATNHPQIEWQIVQGPQKGVAANFLHPLKALPADTDCAAFADQDDVWCPDKLAHAQAMLKDQTGPAIFCSRTWVCDGQLNRLHMSSRPKQPPAFANALVQNIVAGNTLVMNKAAWEILARLPVPDQLPLHDWWVYQVITGVGGTVIWDDTPHVLYRQHGRNEIGNNRGVLANLRRAGAVLGRRFQSWNTINVAGLNAIAAHLTPQAQEQLTLFGQARRGGIWSRAKALHQSGVYRQGVVGTLTLWGALLLNRI